ncbi:5'-Nucleotidase-related protein [Fructobacillus pseudoficulneus]|uniref:5'-Nucleotidase-related protein n=1 Tax=Fructobacillus pseudoficulneus TaxID=220714 RepID=A0A3F3H0N1_9LACO|nr:bifunctional UDP-sugar hydrolase/5'-nucleotidase [Fructobacillus pseudoficulneus]GAP02228.1 5'-Nucleotidase-related protein [Fructobacillus pseudoficulneus]SEH36128.1 2',3'-cyclic-nucleotide 2'-phosphodiesterase/5'-or 3'-nucleotidase, 5'-nucleotidase family [Fructobacillus pseudoficulneus]
METIQIRHTNDLHSHFESWPRVSRFLQSPKMADTTYKFDIGDALDRFHPLTDATLGRANVEYMNAVHYDAVTIGNNEGLGMSHDDLNHLYDDANYPVLLANLKEMPGERQPKWAKPDQIFTTAAGTKVAVIGLTAPYELTYRSLNWEPKEVKPVLDQLLPELRAQADLVVLLSHLGLPTDRELAEEYDIDVIIGAHTHHVLPKGELKNGTLLAAAGRYGDHVGQIDLTLDDNHQVVDKVAQAIPFDQLAVEPGDAATIKAIHDKGAALERSHQVVYFDQMQTVAEQGQACLSALQESTNLPVAFCSSGLFLQPLPAGMTTAEDFLESVPHAIHPMVVTLTGSELEELWSEFERDQAKLVNQKVKGSGFRGQVFGQLLVRGMGRNAAGDLVYDGRIVVASEKYQIATLDHYRWVDFFDVLDEAPAKIRLDIFLRELLAQYYQKHRDSAVNVEKARL